MLAIALTVAVVYVSLLVVGEVYSARRYAEYQRYLRDVVVPEMNRK